MVGRAAPAADVPERMSPAGRRVGDDEALAIGDTAKAGLAREVGAALAGAVQGEDQRQRAGCPGWHVDEHVAPVDAHDPVARAQRHAAGRGVRGVDGERAGGPRHQRDAERAGEYGQRRANTHWRLSAKVTTVTHGSTKASPARRGRPSAASPSASRPAPTPWTVA